MERDEELPEWEMSKENVQPRKHGRSVKKLNVGLSAKTEGDSSHSLRAEKEKYEAALRCYEGDDPLSVWYDYIIWTEENFPSGSKSTRLQELLTSCVKQFEHSDAYKDDDRFIQIWITFAGKCKEKHEVYKHMQSKKIGLRSAIFYKTWALAVEELGNTKMADKIFLQGLENGAKPKDLLKRAREDFEARTCRGMMEKMTTEDTSEEVESVQRQTLVPLASTSKGRVPHNRVAAARPTLTNKLDVGRSATQQKPMQVFTDEREHETTAPKEVREKSVLPNVKENEFAAGKWTEPSRKHRSHQSARPAANAEAKFDVHTDSESSDGSTHVGNIKCALGLSIKKGGKKTEDGPFQTYVMTSYQPGEVIQELPMYNKTKVYAGVTEYSFEELRAIKWQKSEEKRQAEKENHAIISALRQSLEADTQRQLVELKAMKRQLIEEMVGDMRAVRDELLSELDSRVQRVLSAAETVSKASAMEEMEYKTPNDKAASSASSSISVSTKRHRTPDTSSAKRSFVKTGSFTETKDWLMKCLYNQTLAAEPQQPLVENQRGEREETNRDEGAGFAVYADEHSTDQPSMHAVTAPVAAEPAVGGLGGSKFSAFKKPAACSSQQVQPATTFAVYADETEGLDVRRPAQTVVADIKQENASVRSAEPISVPSSSRFAVHTDVQQCVQVPPTNVSLAAGQSIGPEPGVGPLSSSSRLPAPSVPAFAVFADESQLVAEKPASTNVAAFRDPSQDKENNCYPGRNSVSRSRAGSESMEYHTDFDIRAKFAQQAHAASTPFISSDKVTMPDVGVSEIKPHRTVPVSGRPSIHPVDFVTATQILSPITEQSRESASGSSSCKSRSRVSSEGESTEESHMDQVIAASKSRHLHAPPTLDVVAEDSAEVLQRVTPVIDTSFYQPLELTQAQLNTTIFIDSSDPFSSTLQAKLLKKVDISMYDNVSISTDPMPKVKVGSKLHVSDLTLKVTGKLGVGGFASIYKAAVVESRTSQGSISDISKMSSVPTSSRYEVSELVCVKVQKPACPWELYICRELADRMSCMDNDVERDIGTRVMHVSSAAFYSDGSLMVNDLVTNGSLLSLVNSAKAHHKKISEALVMYITIELLHTIEVLHRCKVIHGDVKPDNVLFLGFPKIVEESAPFQTSSIKLIDFGRGIDMSKFPASTTFTASNQTEGFMCIEMKTQQPWTYQTDLFGLLGTVFPLLFLDYMKVQYRNDRWEPHKFHLSRNYKSPLWRKLFDEFLNVPSCDHIPDIAAWREAFEQEFTGRLDEYSQTYSIMNSLVSGSK